MVKIKALKMGLSVIIQKYKSCEKVHKNMLPLCILSSESQYLVHPKKEKKQ